MAEYRVTVNGQTFLIRESGGGIPFLWMHGMFHSLAVEDLFSVIDFETLDREVRLIRIGLPAHNNLSIPASYMQMSWHSLAADLRLLADTLAPDGYFAGGFSQGAGIAAHLAQADRRVKGLVLAMLPQIWDERPKIVSTYRKLLAALKEPEAALILKRLFRQAHYPPSVLGNDEVRSEKIMHLMLKNSVEALRSVLEGAIDSDFPDPAGSSEIEVPALLAGWPGDPNHPMSSFHQLNRLPWIQKSFILQDKGDISAFSDGILAMILSKV